MKLSTVNRKESMKEIDMSKYQIFIDIAAPHPIPCKITSGIVGVPALIRHKHNDNLQFSKELFKDRDAAVMFYRYVNDKADLLAWPVKWDNEKMEWFWEGDINDLNLNCP